MTAQLKRKQEWEEQKTGEESFTFQKMVSTEALAILDVLDHVVSKLVNMSRCPVLETAHA